MIWRRGESSALTLSIVFSESLACPKKLMILSPLPMAKSVMLMMEAVLLTLLHDWDIVKLDKSKFDMRLQRFGWGSGKISLCCAACVEKNWSRGGRNFLQS